MPLITETYYLSLTQDNRGILRLRCSQDDTLRTVNLKLYNNGSIFVIPSGVSASISGVKQNGAVFSKPCTISQNRDSVVLQLSSDITNVDGIIIAEIVLSDGEGGRLGTSNFIIQVEKNPIRSGVVQDAETPIEYINDFIEKIQTLTARLNNLITPSGDPSLAEVVDARISSLDGNTYQNLKARIDADIATLNVRKANKSEVYTKSQVDDLLANIEIDVDDELSDESENPVQNKVINREISAIKADLDAIVPGLSNSAKEALLACFKHVAFLDDDADYYSALENALYPDRYPKITAVFGQGANVIYTDDSLDTLKQYLTVKYYETSSSSGTVISSSNYSISGSLSEGNNRLVVTYGTYITSFNVTAVDFYNIFTWTMGENLTKLNGGIDPQADYSPSRLSISATSAANYQRRRTMVTNHGKRQIYRPSTTTPETSSWKETGYYPIPVPLSANHVKITMSPLQDIYAHFVPYIESSNNYGGTTTDNRITWTTIPSAGLEKNIVQSDAGQLFMIANFRYNSSASDYLIEPSEIKIEFSEV